MNVSITVKKETNSVRTNNFDSAQSKHLYKCEYLIDVLFSINGPCRYKKNEDVLYCVILYHFTSTLVSSFFVGIFFGRSIIRTPFSIIA